MAVSLMGGGDSEAVPLVKVATAIKREGLKALMARLSLLLYILAASLRQVSSPVVENISI